MNPDVIEEELNKNNLPQKSIHKFRKKIIFVILAILAITLLIIEVSKRIIMVSNNEQIRKTSNNALRTHTIAFIRDGDVWISNTDGNKQKKVTMHTSVKYHWQHVSGRSKPQIIDDSDKFNKLPKLSPDGKYLVFLSFTRESLKELEEREKRIATESSEIKQKGASEIFSSSGLEYELKLYNLYTQKYVDTILNGNVPKGMKGCEECFNSINWARNKNFLAYINNFKLYTLNEKIEHGKISFEYSGTTEDFCWTNCHDISTTNSVISLASDGTKLSSTYSFYTVPQACNNTIGHLVLTLNLVNWKTSLQKSDNITCSISIGGWYNDNDHYITDEYRLKGGGYYKNTYSKPNKKEKIFEDNESLDGIPLQLSSDNQWAAYLVGSLRELDSETDLRIRNLHTGEYFDVRNTVNNNLHLNKRRIFYPKWDFDSKNIYFELSNTNIDKDKLVIKFDTLSKHASILVFNAEQVDIN